MVITSVLVRVAVVMGSVLLSCAVAMAARPRKVKEYFMVIFLLVFNESDF